MKAVHIAVAFVLLSSWGCTYGGPSGSATELLGTVKDPATADPEVDAADTAPPTFPSSGPPSDPPPTTLGDAGSDAETAANACGPSVVPGCDPVRGTGCAQGISQCSVDPGPAVPTGRCIFSGAPASAGCDENGLYSTCPPLHTCKAGECRKYCYCDSDCDAGDTCSEPSGQGSSSVFKLCAGTRP